MKGTILLVCLALAAAACGDGGDGSEASYDDDAGGVTTLATTSTAPPSGLTAQAGDAVAVHYVGTLDDGTQFDSSHDRNQTLDFTIGSGQMISGFDEGVKGMMEGETKTIRIEAADAYGDFNPDAVIEVGLDQVPEGTQVGDRLRDPVSGGPVTVIEITDEIVRIDRNHPLAGEALTFVIEMISITR